MPLHIPSHSNLTRPKKPIEGRFLKPNTRALALSLAALTTLLLAASPPEQEEVVMDEARYIIAVLENRAFESIASAEHARGEGVSKVSSSR